jgi:NitT/TauT family transport system ATP-binding protein
VQVEQRDLKVPVQSTKRGARVDLEGIGQVFVHGSSPVTALWDVSLTIPDGQFVSLVGPSGCGKTTILGVLSGLLKPSQGNALIDGQPVNGPRRDVAYMFARDALMPWRSVRKNVEFAMQVQGVAVKERRETASRWLDRVGLSRYENSPINKLSQGMRQRVAIARTLALTPRLILMDEPFAALDAQTRALQQAHFTRLWEELNCTVIFVTHDLTEAIRLSDRVILIGSRPGRIVADLPIDIARPRQLDDAFNDPQFVEYHSYLSTRLSKEVLASGLH